jgi:O-antigen biosynthesis protein
MSRVSVEQRLRVVTRRKLPADVEDVVPGGAVHSCCRLTDDLLLVVGSFPIWPDEPLETWLLAAGAWRRVRSEILTFETSSAERRLVLVHLNCIEAADHAAIGTLSVRLKRHDLVLEPTELASTLTSLDTLVDDELLRAVPHARAAISDFLVRATADAIHSPLKLSRMLFRVREALRERPSTSAVGSVEPRAVAVDAIWEIDDRAFYIAGWQRQEDPTPVRLIAISPEGERVELDTRAFRHPRADVVEFYGLEEERHADKMGFVAYFETNAPSRLGEGWIVQIHDAAGCVAEAAASQVSRDLRAVRARVLGDFALETLPDKALKANHTLPAVSRLQRRLASAVAIESIAEFGEPSRSAEVSVVVPLFRRIDFLEYQLAEFVQDPELRAADLVYVLDSPEQADHLRTYALHLHRLYGVPFRVAMLTRNGGFAIANNLGASVARGRLLLLLNSDVLPERPGWLGQLVRFYDATSRIGALGPKLVYEDDSLQHAGLYFDRPSGSHVWTNEHYFKGLHRDLPAANVARRVPAVTGACMLISLSLFRELGGLRGSYVQGDYEDSDLCLRLAEQGLETWYLPSVALYHLEGQSYPSEERALASQFNRWLHTYLWEKQIADTASKSVKS